MLRKLLATWLLGLCLLFAASFPAWAVVVGTNLTSNSAASASSATTASITIPAHTLGLLLVETQNNTASAVPTATSTGITWTQVATVAKNDGFNFIQTTVFRTLPGTTFTGTVTIDCAGVTQFQIVWSADKFTGTLLTGSNGSGAIIQSVTGSVTGSATGLSISLAALASGSASYGGLGRAFQGASTVTAGSGYTELAQVSINPANLESEYKQVGSMTVNWTWITDTKAAAGIAIEIGAVASGGSIMKLMGTGR